MTMATKVDELFISLGLDITQFDRDFAAADKAVKEAVSKLARQQTQTKLKMEIDATKFIDAENSVDALNNRLGHLNTQLQNQRNIVTLINKAYEESVRIKGTDDTISQRLLTRLLKEQRAQADLERQIKQTNNALKANTEMNIVSGGATEINASTKAFNAIAAAATGAGTAITSARNGLIALGTLAVTGGGLFTVVKGAVDAGEAVYQMATKMQISSEEAAKLNRILRLADVDSQSFISTMIRLDRGIQTAGKNGNEVTNALRRFGVSLVDENNKLLPLNQQLERLAAGYQQAALAGEEEAFVSEILGARGAALIPVLKDYSTYMEALGRVKTIGIDTQQAHELSVELKVLKLESAQLGNAFGAALLPIAKELAPDIIVEMQEIITSIKENKGAITEFGKGSLQAVKGAVEAFGTLGGTAKTALEVLGNLVGDSKIAAKEVGKLAVEVYGLSKAIDAINKGWCRDVIARMDKTNPTYYWWEYSIRRLY